MSRSDKLTLCYLDESCSAHLFAEIEALHRRQLSAGALAHMPRGFLSRFYLMLAESEDCCVIAAVQKTPDDTFSVRAFVAGSIASSTLRRRLLTSSPIAILFDGIRLLAKPSLFARVVGISRKMNRIEAQVDENQLLSIAVAPESARTGLGQQMVAELGRWFVDKGQSSYDLIASDTQTAALAFYDKLGAQTIGKTDLGGLNSFVLRVNLEQ